MGERKVCTLSHQYKDLIVWQKSKELAAEIYRATSRFPRSELCGITGQLRRAAVSVPFNIAEGLGRLTVGEFRHFLGQSRGSLLALETPLAIAAELNYVGKAAAERLELLTNEVKPSLNGLLSSLSARSARVSV